MRYAIISCRLTGHFSRELGAATQLPRPIERRDWIVLGVKYLPQSVRLRATISVRCSGGVQNKAVWPLRLERAHRDIRSVVGRPLCACMLKTMTT